MLIKIQDHSFNVLFKLDEIKKKIPIIFLHGFTGSVNDWDFIQGNINKSFTPVCIDLIGHGKSSSPIEIEYYNFDSQVKYLNDIINYLSIDKLCLAGYSMGGRLSALYSLIYPSKIMGLILESTSFGILKKKEREKRILSDQMHVKKIDSLGMMSFIDYWFSLPLFDSLKTLSVERYKYLKEQRIKNNKTGLKNTLLGFSTGRMKYLIPEMKKIRFRVLLIAGELDTKFMVISNKALEQIPDSDLKIVQDSGHNVHFEKPKEFLKLINEFLSNIEKTYGL